MTQTVAPGWDAVFLCLQPFIVDVVGGDVIRLPTNRVASPKGSFVGLTPLMNGALSTNVKTPASATTQTTTRPSQITVQVDCYGPNAGDTAAIICDMLRDSYACEFFAAINPQVQPLYASDARMLPLVGGESQYIDRWTFEAVLQFNPATVNPQESASTLAIANFFPIP